MVRKAINLSCSLVRFFSLGYDSVYLKRSGDKPDGCCIFYKINRLRLINSKLVPFYHGHIPVLDR